jgi:hypothetical protein
MGWNGTMADSDRGQAQLANVRSFVDEVNGADLPAKRIDSLAGATLGVMQSASLAVTVIGQALAQAGGLVTKHAINQVDRMLSNNGIDVWDGFARGSVANLADRSAWRTFAGSGFGGERVMIEFKGSHFERDVILWAVRC